MESSLIEEVVEVEGSEEGTPGSNATPPNVSPTYLKERTFNDYTVVNDLFLAPEKHELSSVDEVEESQFSAATSQIVESFPQMLSPREPPSPYLPQSTPLLQSSQS